MSVYEICDTTDDEMYFPLGIFETREKALAEINKADEVKEKISEHSDDNETITVYKRVFGWTELGTPVVTIKRERYYDEKADDYYWRRVTN